jgi:hypothetical protein
VLNIDQFFQKFASQHSPQIRVFPGRHKKSITTIDQLMKKLKFITSFWNEFSFLLRSCSCLLGLYLAGVSLMLCIFCASCSRPRLLFISNSLLCTACRVAVSCFMFHVAVVDGVTKCARRIGDGDKAKSNRLRVY